MLNHIVLHGRLVRDPEIRYTQGGDAVCSFTLAVDRDVKGRDGTRLTDFIDCTAWRGTAELLGKYFRKGSLAIVEGRLELKDWTDKSGNKRKSASVNVNGLYFGDSKKDSAPASSTPAYNTEPRAGMPDGTADFAELPDLNDDDLPF